MTQLPYGTIPGTESTVADQLKLHTTQETMTTAQMATLVEQISRFMDEVFDEGDEYPFTEMTADEQKRIANQFDRRYAMLIG